MNDSARPTAPAASTPRPRDSWLAIGLTLVIAVYGIGYLLWYLQTPLGRAPQLDSAENLALARQIADGTLAHEPFYRALLYPAVLAIPLKLGLHTYVLPAFAALLGLLCHFLITLGIARLAIRVWDGPRAQAAGLLAAVLWGLNPVALFYAVDALDTVPSLALAVWALVAWSHPGGRKRDVWLGGILLGLAVAARPHFLPWVFMAPLFRAWLSCRWKLQRADALAWAGALAVLITLGGVQKYWSGQFAILPAQGPYNFYAANHPGANGKYYAQKLLFSEIAPGENPARKEAELLYAEASKTNSVPENVYWYGQAWSAIGQDPGAWLKLLAKKAYYLLNDFDQYNNKTYAWHQAESPFLKWNFLGWGVLLVLAAGIMGLRGRGKATLTADFNCPMVAIIWAAILVYAAGAILYYASGRFRLPLMPLLCILAGGWMAWPGWAALSRWQIVRTPVALVAAAGIAFSSFFAAHDEATFIQDELLSANAAAQVGDDAAAYHLAKRVLARDPARPDARRIAVVSFFNLSLSHPAETETAASWQEEAKLLDGVPIHDATLALVAGAAAWKTGHPEQALAIWQEAASRFGQNSTAAQAWLAAKVIQGETLPPGTLAPDPQLVEYLKKKPN